MHILNIPALFPWCACRQTQEIASESFFKLPSPNKRKAEWGERERGKRERDRETWTKSGKKRDRVRERRDVCVVWCVRPCRACMPAFTKRTCIVESHVTALPTSTVCFKYPKDTPSKPSAKSGPSLEKHKPACHGAAEGWGMRLGEESQGSSPQASTLALGRPRPD